MTATPGAPPPRKWPLRIAAAAVVLALVGWQGRVQYAAWQHLKAGRVALERDAPRAARAHLEQCLDDWPRSAEAHFLAGRAARRCGDAPSALRHYSAAAGFGYDAGEVEIERALGALAEGDFAFAEPVLARAIETGHPAAAEIAEALVPQYLAAFRLNDAAALSAKWVEAAPDAPKAWALRGDVLERLRNKDAAAAALRRAVALAPTDRAARGHLVRLLLETRQAPDEAAGHAEWLANGASGDHAVTVQLAACREMQGRADDAAALLDGALKAVPKNAAALHLRGKIEMNRGRPAEALAFLHRGAEADPSDAELLYSLFVCLQRAGTPAEARAAEERWKRCDADLRRVGELTRQVSAKPDDPDLRREIGALFLRNGRPADGVRWLESALRVNPGHAATHAALAAHYETAGDPTRAAAHRARASGAP